MNYVGVDFHKSFSQVAVMDESGKVQENVKLLHRDKEKLRKYFRRFQCGTPVTFEATRSWYWFSDLLEELEMEAHMVHPLKTKLIAEARIKTDKIDAETLALLTRAGLLVESRQLKGEQRDLRDYLRHRIYLVHIRSALKAKVHVLLDKFGIQLPRPMSDLFGHGGRAWLEGLEFKPPFDAILQDLLAQIDLLSTQIQAVEEFLQSRIQAHPDYDLLITVPGVGLLTAALILTEIGSIDGFPRHQKLVAFVGLAPSTHQSGNQCYQGRITKQGNRYIRWALVEAVTHAVDRDPFLRTVYHRLSRKKGKAKARVAIARKLLVSIYYVLKNKEPYRTNRGFESQRPVRS